MRRFGSILMLVASWPSAVVAGWPALPPSLDWPTLPAADGGGPAATVDWPSLPPTTAREPACCPDGVCLVPSLQPPLPLPLPPLPLPPVVQENADTFDSLTLFVDDAWRRWSEDGSRPILILVTTGGCPACRRVESDLPTLRRLAGEGYLSAMRWGSSPTWDRGIERLAGRGVALVPTLVVGTRDAKGVRWRYLTGPAEIERYAR